MTMVFKLKYKVGGGHTWVRLFAGPDVDHLGKCGEFTMRNEEWMVFRFVLAGGEEAAERANPTATRVLIEEDTGNVT